MMKKLAVALVLSAFCASAATLSLAEEKKAAPAPAKAAVFSRFVDKDGKITLPKHVRVMKDWVHLGSWVVPDEKAPGYGFHDVYTQRRAVAVYEKTGKFPDGTMIVKEIRKINTADMKTGKASWAGDRAIWFVMVKDSQGRFKNNPNWGDGWGWALFKAEDPTKNVSTDHAKDCIPCHVPAKENDWVYIKGYPALRK